MDTMVLLVGDSRHDEGDDCVRLYNLVGVPIQVHWMISACIWGRCVESRTCQSSVSYEISHG